MGSSVDNKNANRIKGVKYVGTLADGEVWVFDFASGNMIPGTPGGGGGATENQIHVMGGIGNDGTGVVGDPSKPFKTLLGARNAAVAHASGGDGLQVIVYPETYTSTDTTNYAVDGLAWYFHKGAILNHAQNSIPFNINGFTKPASIKGSLELNVTAGNQRGFYIYRTHSDIEFDSISNTGAGVCMEIDCLNAIGLNISTVIKGRELLGTGSGSSLYTTYNGNYGRMKIDIGQVRQTGTGYAFRNGNGSQGKSLSAIFGYVESAASYGIYTGGGTLICDYVYGGGTAGIAFSGGSGDEASFMGETNKLIISGGQEVNFNGYVNDTATISQVSSRLVGGTCYKLVLTDGYADTTVEFNATITAGQARLKRVDDSSTPKIICNGGVTHILDDVYGGGSLVSQATGVIAINNDAKLFLHGYNVMDGANNWKFISMNHADCIVDLLGSTIDLQGTVSLNREVSGIDYKAGTLISNGATILTNGQGIPIKTASASDELIMKGTLNTNYLGTLETGNIKRKKFIPSNVATTTISLDDTTGGAEVFSETDTVTYNTKALLSERMVQLINASGTLDITASQDTPFTDEYFYLDGDIAGLEWVESIFANLAAEYVTVGTAGFTKIGGGTVVQHANII